MEKVMCNLLVQQSAQNGAGSILQVFPVSGEPYKIIVSKSQMKQFNFGDRLKCISGTIAVLVSPGTKAGIFLLSPYLPVNPRWNERTEIEINDETTRMRPRIGKIVFREDIGNIMRGTGAVTR